LEIVEGGFYFHPNNEDLSLGTPVRKKPLGFQDSVKSRIENAVAGNTGNVAIGTTLHDIIEAG